MYPVEAVLLLGPTACGKSALALRLARDLTQAGTAQQVEIVSVDSAQVYRGLDIGTAKPSAAERAAVPHHLIDLRDPGDPYSAADFVRDARAAIADIRARGGRPLLVGGTMLYAKALREGLSTLPAAAPDIRARLEAEARAHGWPALHARLARVDAASAARLPPNDSQRIQRALEVYEQTGTPLSALQTSTRTSAPALPTIALLPADRAALHRRIEARFDAMLAAGFMAEVRVLKQRADLGTHLPALRAVGYRQAWEHLDGKASFDEFRTAAIAATRQLAKRQITWLRSMPEVSTIDPFAADAYDALRAVVAQHWR